MSATASEERMPLSSTTARDPLAPVMGRRNQATDRRFRLVPDGILHQWFHMTGETRERIGSALVFQGHD